MFLGNQPPILQVLCQVHPVILDFTVRSRSFLRKSQIPNPQPRTAHYRTTVPGQASVPLADAWDSGAEEGEGTAPRTFPSYKILLLPTIPVILLLLLLLLFWLSISISWNYSISWDYNLSISVLAWISTLILLLASTYSVDNYKWLSLLLLLFLLFQGSSYSLPIIIVSNR